MVSLGICPKIKDVTWLKQWTGWILLCFQKDPFLLFTLKQKVGIFKFVHSENFFCDQKCHLSVDRKPKLIKKHFKFIRISVDRSSKREWFDIFCLFLRQVWSLAEGSCLMTLTGHHDAVTCLNLTFDSRKVISGSLDHNLKFWDLLNGKVAVKYFSNKIFISFLFTHLWMWQHTMINKRNQNSKNSNNTGS